MLQPYLGRARSDWYRGTADAIYHNLFYVEETRATDVLILSGDHVYAMDYRADAASCTGSKTPTSRLRSSRCRGKTPAALASCRSTNAGLVIDFDEKPAIPRSNLASMGVYVFKADVLRASSNARTAGRTDDRFRTRGHPVPDRRRHVYAYRFENYWRDVGTLQSYWEANMEQLQDVPGLNLYDPDWRIHTRSEERPPAKVMDGSHVSRAMLSHGCIVIRGSVTHSVLSPGVTIHEGAVVRDSIIMTDAVIGP